MKRSYKAVVLAAILVILGAGTAVVFLLCQRLDISWNNESGSGGASSGVVEESRSTAEAEIMTPSAVTLEDHNQSPVYHQIPKAALPAASGCNAVSPQQGRDSLTEEAMVELYDRIGEKAYRVSETMGENQMYPIERITVRSGSLTDGQVVQALTAFLHDHPEVFWISNRYGYSTGENRTVVQLYAVVSPSECETLSQRVTKEAAQILQKLPAGADALEKEIYLYEQIIQSCQYDEEGAADDQDWRAHSIVGIFLDGEAVCEGYSRALQLLLNQCGVPSMVVTGTAGGSHMWNLVRIDGQWYHADATWDDHGEEPLYRYLNLTDAMIAEDHTLYPQADQVEELKGDQVYNVSLPACTAVKANYFWAKGVHFTASQDTGELTQKLKKAAASGRKSVQLYVEEGVDYDQALEALFQKSPYLFSYAVQQANLTAEVSIEYNQCTYVEARACRGIVILLTYGQQD